MQNMLYFLAFFRLAEASTRPLPSRVIHARLKNAKKNAFSAGQRAFTIHFKIYHLCVILTRHVESSREDPGYAAVDREYGLGPRVLPQGPKLTGAPRNNGPRDPTVPYALPQKKKSRKPRSEPSEPAIGK